MHVVRTLVAFLLILPLTAVAVHAQSALDRATVSKSKLAYPVFAKHDQASTLVVDHSAWDAFLGKYVATDSKGVNRVAYGAVSTADKQALDAYLKALQSIDVTSLNRDEQYAFWLNLYNASMVKVNLDNYPIKSVFDIKSSILDFKGPFNDDIARVNGKVLTLDTIESGIVRPVWNDPRLHYAFNCAAVSCPNLGKQAYKGSSINTQLDQAAISYVNDPRGIRVKGAKVTASKIYFWYQKDFGRNEKAVLDHIRRYAREDLKASLSGASRIDAYEYDWALNGR